MSEHSEQYAFQDAVYDIWEETYDHAGSYRAKQFPRSFRDNDPVSRLLCIDWRTLAGRDGWLDYFGAKADGNVAWASDWHGWRVLMTAHFSDVEDSGPVGIEQRHGSPPADPGTALLAEGEAAAADLMGDACIDAAARRIHGLHRAADLDEIEAVVSAILDPDAMVAPCGQTTRHEVHDSHTRHVGACSRWCGGWANEPTVQMATVTR